MTPDTEAKLLQDIGSINNKVDDLVKMVKGNGKPGLYDRVGKIENCLSDHLTDYENDKAVKAAEKADAKKKTEIKLDNKTKIIMLLVSVVISYVGSIIFGLVKTFIQP